MKVRVLSSDPVSSCNPVYKFLVSLIRVHLRFIRVIRVPFHFTSIT
jgi:hypothetical protein